ncbi:MAG: putative sugar nucleotidyl transferase [Bacteroidia bacterium]|nr:putative sugar nucleotidyl transferase [Bacteroidia bacterium]MDW8089437.1 putative sugar nucleotidyl transferase [Bacteroidia bacterium]
MQIAFFEDDGWVELLPFTRLRPIWAIWWGTSTLAEKWSAYYGWHATGQLPAQKKLWRLFPPIFPEGDTVWVNARLLPLSAEFNRWLHDLGPDRLYVTSTGEAVALRTRRLPCKDPEKPQTFGQPFPTAEVPSDLPLMWLRTPTQLFTETEAILLADWQALQAPSATPPPTAQVLGRDNLYLHPSARIGLAFLDATTGPLWIGPGVEIQHGAIIYGPGAIGPHTTIMAKANIRTHNSFGPWCKIGGEVAVSTFLGYSNKSHDGFLGHSVIGAWCNIGAGSNTSNLKNTYGPVRLYHPASGELRPTGLQFCGLLMGDYARCGIQTPFTTGCVVDIFANIVGQSFTPKYVPPFYWAEGAVWQLAQALETARRMKARRGQTLSEAEAEVLTLLYHELTPIPKAESSA